MTSYEYHENAEFSELTGKTLTSVKGLSEGSGKVEFICSDGTKYKMFHYQNCCESVDIEDINESIDDILNTSIVIAEERISNKKVEDSEASQDKGYGSFTWTFYTLRTIKGTVTIRWYGESNGYYSESVDFKRVE